MGDELQLLQKRKIGHQIGFQPEIDHGGIAGHLPGRHLMLRVAFKARIADQIHFGVRFQETGYLHGIFSMFLHPQRKGYQAAHNQPGIERADAGAQVHNAAFADIGQVWLTPEVMQLDELKLALGGGVAISTPVGPIRFDVAWNATPPPEGEPLFAFHFSVGNPF